MIRWHGLDGNWIEIGLPPHFISIERKPEDGCEVQNLECAESGIMLRIEIITGATDKNEKAFEGGCNHGTAVLKRLVSPWVCSDRVICADSYFESVQSAVHLLQLGLRFKLTEGNSILLYDAICRTQENLEWHWHGWTAIDDTLSPLPATAMMEVRASDCSGVSPVLVYAECSFPYDSQKSWNATMILVQLLISATGALKMTLSSNV